MSCSGWCIISCPPWYLLTCDQLEYQNHHHRNDPCHQNGRSDCSHCTCCCTCCRCTGKIWNAFWCPRKSKSRGWLFQQEFRFLNISGNIRWTATIYLPKIASRILFGFTKPEQTKKTNAYNPQLLAKDNLQNSF